MAGPAGLPNLDTLDIFSYYDFDQDAFVDIVRDDNTHARVTQDYVINPTDCEYSRAYLAADPRLSLIRFCDSNSLTYYDAILYRLHPGCCPGQQCIDIAQGDFKDLADFKLRIQEAQWGYGVFATAHIPRGTLIGEYMGCLMPLDYVTAYTNAYTFLIDNHANSDAQQYGNITRFVNHHCDPNTEPVKTMYGKRAVMVFRTIRDITAGEELTIDYGENYFDTGNPCQCDAFPYHHTSERYHRRVYPDGKFDNHGFRVKGDNPRRRSSAAVPAQPWRKEAAGAVVAKKLADGRRKAKSRPRTLETAAKPQRRRLSWGSRGYKEGDPDRIPTRRADAWGFVEVISSRTKRLGNRFSKPRTDSVGPDKYDSGERVKVIRFVHRSATEFLLQPEIWREFVEEWGGPQASDFDSLTALMALEVQALKRLSYDNSQESLDALVLMGLYTGRRALLAEESTKQASPRLLLEMDRVMSLQYEKFKDAHEAQDVRNYELLVAAGEHPPVPKCSTIMSFAASLRLKHFLKYPVASHERGAIRQEGQPLLSYAGRVLFRGSDVLAEDLKIRQMLEDDVYLQRLRRKWRQRKADSNISRALAGDSV
ncbi:Histone-lysine N-methyltransferase ehmt1 [Diaporthe australafricana]|uniref:Histone-lysine N-methyltransferase ehmt1 n=1 Tax=Diaporthe australafricana TaxID=127596 RepID=A0ABR3WJT7_9PEZI